MAYLKSSAYSEVLGQWIHFDAIIPQKKDKDIKTLYLLHGLKFDYSSWARRTTVEQYADAAQIAVIMPDAGRSFYTDMVNGRAYYTFVSDEIIKITRNLFHLSSKREDTTVAGLSMGGYGAYKLAFLNPETFSKAASMSGALDISVLTEPEMERDNMLITGGKTDLKGSEYDLYHLSEKLSRSGGEKPRLLQICGKSDEMYEANVKFSEYIKAKGYDSQFIEAPGEHNWLFWQEHIKKVIDFAALD